MTEYKERLAEAMQDAGVSNSALARALGLSYQGVKKVIDGRSKAFTAANNEAAAEYLKVSSRWLATGRGVKRPYAIGEEQAHHASRADESSLTAPPFSGSPAHWKRIAQEIARQLDAHGLKADAGQLLRVTDFLAEMLSETADDAGIAQQVSHRLQLAAAKPDPWDIGEFMGPLVDPNAIGGKPHLFDHIPFRIAQFKTLGERRVAVHAALQAIFDVTAPAPKSESIPAPLPSGLPNPHSAKGHATKAHG